MEKIWIVEIRHTTNSYGMISVAMEAFKDEASARSWAHDECDRMLGSPAKKQAMYMLGVVSTEAILREMEVH